MTEVSALSPVQKSAEFRESVKQELGVVDLADGAQFDRMRAFEEQTQATERAIAGIGTVVTVRQVTISSWQEVGKVISAINDSDGDLELDVRFGSKIALGVKAEIEEALASFGQSGNLGELVEKLNATKDEKHFDELTLKDGKGDLEVKVSRFDDRASTRDPDRPPAFDPGDFAAAMRDVNRAGEPIQGHYLIVDERDEVKAAEAVAIALLQVKSDADLADDAQIKAGSDFRLILRQPKVAGSTDHSLRDNYHGFQYTAEQILQRVANKSQVVKAAIDALSVKVDEIKAAELKRDSAAALNRQNREQADRLERDAKETVLEAERKRQEAVRLKGQTVSEDNVPIDVSQLPHLGQSIGDMREGLALRAARNVGTGVRLSVRKRVQD